MERELKLIHEALDDIKGLPTKLEVKESKPLRLVRQFIDKLENADTNIGKVTKTIDNGIGYARKFDSYYNGIAPVAFQILEEKMRVRHFIAYDFSSGHGQSSFWVYGN